MRRNEVRRIIEESLGSELEEAKNAGQVGFMARALVQATMPHSQVSDVFFQRVNGKFNLTMMAPPQVGLPYGSIPRLLMAWLSTEAVRTRERRLILGDNLSSFMHELGLVPTGGRWGSIGRLKDQTRRLFSCSISCNYHTENHDLGVGYTLIDKYNLWWDPKSPDQRSLWKSEVTLSANFFEEITSRPVPIDLQALKVIKRSPLAIDIYCWLTYRMSYLREPTEVPWEALQQQFGASYSFSEQGLRNFKKKFKQQLATVITIYPDANFTETKTGLVLKPSSPHITKPRKKLLCG